MKANAETKIRIKKLYELSKKVFPHNFGQAYPVFYLKERIKEYHRTGEYEPHVLNEIEKDIRRWSRQ